MTENKAPETVYVSTNHFIEERDWALCTNYPDKESKEKYFHEDLLAREYARNDKLYLRNCELQSDAEGFEKELLAARLRILEQEMRLDSWDAWSNFVIHAMEVWEQGDAEFEQMISEFEEECAASAKLVAELSEVVSEQEEEIRNLSLRNELLKKGNRAAAQKVNRAMQSEAEIYEELRLLLNQNEDLVEQLVGWTELSLKHEDNIEFWANYVAQLVYHMKDSS